MVLLSLLVLGASVALAVTVGRWSLVAITAMLLGAIAVYLVVNHGWYGAGWGDFGVAVNAMAGGLVITGAVVGVALRKAMKRGATGSGPFQPDEPFRATHGGR